MGTRPRLLKNPENLDPERDEAGRLEEALAPNEPQATAYPMKDDLRRFWEPPGERFATAFPDGRLRQAEAGIKRLEHTAETLAPHRCGLPAYYDVMITSGLMEQMNNKIETMKRQAYGFRAEEFSELMILATHETGCESVG